MPSTLLRGSVVTDVTQGSGWDGAPVEMDSSVNSLLEGFLHPSTVTATEHLGTPGGGDFGDFDLTEFHLGGSWGMLPRSPAPLVLIRRCELPVQKFSALNQAFPTLLPQFSHRQSTTRAEDFTAGTWAGISSHLEARAPRGCVWSCWARRRPGPCATWESRV